ncbi:MAG: SMP-30/gluconolactonase/LRE family protein [Casimicrobiaceae bacterium]
MTELSATVTLASGNRAPMVARLLRPIDDVATALTDLRKGTVVGLASASVTREVTLCEDIRAGHKFAVHALAAGLRIRKYGEFIGRTTRPVPAGAWVHVHNLATSAHHDANHDHAWYETAETPQAVQVLGSARCHVGENPLYDEATNKLYWIDVRGTPSIHVLALRDNVERCWPMREDVGSIALAGDAQLLVALRSGFALFDCGSGAMTPLVDPEPDLPHNRMNDGKCDAAGRYWCGSMNPESGTADGSLYVLDGDLRCRRVLDDFVTPNGMTWSPDGATMYIADTRRGFIYAFAFDAANGTLGERRIFADLGAMPGGPDGATIDAEGFLWWAQVDSGCIIRYAPDGRMDRVVRLPVSRPTSCGFGGRGYRQLFVTTATRGLSEDDLRGEPLAGRVLVLDVGVAGLPPVPFLPAAAPS